MLRIAALVLAVVVAVTAASCGTRERAGEGIVVAPHAIEIPRSPHPGWHRDGVVVTWIAGDSAWTRGGLAAGDVVESVNGVFPFEVDDFGRAAGAAPREVRIVSSRVGPYGGRVVSIETDRQPRRRRSRDG